MSSMVPTSKFDLKMQCIAITRGDVEAAEKLYTFLAGDIDIPDIAPTKPSVMQQIKETAGGIFGFVKENQNEIIQAYNFMQAIRSGGAIETAKTIANSELPPLVSQTIK